MQWINSSFEWMGNLYNSLFADWIQMHFIVRTVMILFVLWMIIFLLAILVRYVIAPVVMMVYFHVILRGWNYLFVETPLEWIYIRYYSKEKPNFHDLYLRLCDKSDRNRMRIEYAKYKGLIIRSRKFVLHLMLACAIASTLWVSAFGLFHEYAAPVLVIINDDEENGFTEEEIYLYYEEEPIFAEEFPEPFEIGENAMLTLNDAGRQGARLHSGPGITDTVIIEMLWDDAVLIFQNAYVPDEFVSNLYWLRVLSPSGTEGYISSQLVLEEIH